MVNIGSEESEDLARIIAPLTTDAVPAALGFAQASAPAPDASEGLQHAAVASAEAHAPQLLRLRVGMSFTTLPELACYRMAASSTCPT